MMPARRDRPVPGTTLLTVVLVVGMGLMSLGLAPARADRGPLLDGDTTALTVVDDDGETRTHVIARVVNTSLERYLGLSGYDRLDTGTGMWFVYDHEDTRGFVMRGMRFPIDIVFVNKDRKITRIHRATVESGRPLTHYRGRGRWVLEVPLGWSRHHGVEAGDRIVNPYQRRRDQ